MSEKARILFVDDEKRVLNSMRGLFRRDYELYLTTEGADAVKIASEKDIDVVVADQRMPGLTGTEVLGAIKTHSPRTVRILLTGYADPEAVEGSINIGEVFRFLSKPCPPKVLRETLALAIDAARSQPASPLTSDSGTQAETSVPNSANPRQPARATATHQSQPPSPTAHPMQTNAPGPVRARVPRPRPGPVAPPRHIEPPHHFAESAKFRASAAVPTPETTAPDRRSDDPGSRHAGSNTRHMSAAATNTERTPNIPVEGGQENTGQTERIQGRADIPVLKPGPRETPDPSGPEDQSHWGTVTNVVLSEESVQETQGIEAGSTAVSKCVKDVGVIVFTVDPKFAELAIRTFSPDRTTVLATSLVKVAEAVEKRQAGVLITDFTTNNEMLHKMISALKQHMPELVTIVVSDGRDTTEMINLINYGQVFRYVLKPIEPIELEKEVNAAAIKCLHLRQNPDAVKRHRVVPSEAPADASPTLNRFLGRIRKIPVERTNSDGTTSKD